MKQHIELVVVFCLISPSIALRKYQSEVPNGHRIPNPCSPGTIWEGVGHEDNQGGGPRNPFGVDFKDAGYKWTKALCEKDSDGDGRSNGLEMGDPECVWSAGSTPSVTDSSKLSHPGLCEPLDSAICRQKNSFLQECAAIGLTTPTPDSWCPAINDPEVKMIELKYPQTRMSGAETEYKCMVFDLPNDQAYEAIAWEVFADNKEIFHHSILYSCDRDPGTYPDTLRNLTTDYPIDCRMTPPCPNMFIVWAYGQSGQCFSKEFGAPFGKTWRRAILQHHYNNDRQIEGLTDSSGMRIWYQPKKRQLDKSLIAFGQMYLVIPPKTPLTMMPSGLSGECTKRLFTPDQPFYLTSLLIHVHKLGSFARVILKKAKAGYSVILVNETIQYDRPKTAHWQKGHQILLEPGDSFEIDCGFNSMSREDWTFFGSRTNDEMCYAFIDVYPQPGGVNFLMPASLGEYDFCESNPSPYWGLIGECDRYAFKKKFQLLWGSPVSDSAKELIESCACWGPTNYPAKKCSSACFDAMTKYSMFNDPCMMDDRIFQSVMRAWYDDSEILHRAQSQMAFCNADKLEPPMGTSCEFLETHNAANAHIPYASLIISMAIRLVANNAY